MFSRLLPLLLIGASIAMFFMAFQPKYQEVQALRIEEAYLNDALDRAKELQAIRNDLLKEFNTFTSDDLNRLEKLVPEHVDNVRLIIDIDAIAKRYGLSVRDISIVRHEEQKTEGDTQAGRTLRERQATVVDGSRKSAVESLEFGFGVHASYETFLQFLRDLEKSLRVIDITSLQFASGGDSSDLYAFEIVLRTYWLAGE